MNKRTNISARLWLRSGAPPEIVLVVTDDCSRRIVRFSLEGAERIRNVLGERLAEARRLDLLIDQIGGSAPHA